MATITCGTCRGRGTVKRPSGWVTCGNCKGRKTVER